MPFPLYEKIDVTAGEAAHDPCCIKPVVRTCAPGHVGAERLVYEKGRMPENGADIYRWLYLKNGLYAGATCWYADPDDAVEECHVAMRKKAQDKNFDSVVSQTGTFRAAH